MEQKLLLITNKKSVIAFQESGLYSTCDATWRRKQRFVTFVLRQNREKSRITQKLYEMERKLLLITNRKSMIASQNQELNFTCDDTWRRKQRFVTSGLPQIAKKSLITQKRYEMEQKLLLITNMKSVIAFQNLP